MLFVPLDDLYGVVSAAAIDDDVFKVRIPLLNDRQDGLFKKSPLVEGWVGKYILLNIYSIGAAGIFLPGLQLHPPEADRADASMHPDPVVLPAIA